jgi:hypothetical protein
MFADELGEGFVRNGLAISGKYLYLSTQYQDIAYGDERTWPVPSSYTLGHATSQESVVVGRQRTRCSSA